MDNRCASIQLSLVRVKIGTIFKGEVNRLILRDDERLLLFKQD